MFQDCRSPVALTGIKTSTAPPGQAAPFRARPGIRMLPAQNVMLSYGRCCASPVFFDDFYRRFLASSPRVREKFVHTDMATQKRLLRHGIMNLVLVARSLPATKLRQLGESHCRARLDIGPELYELWVDCLLTTLAQHDPDFSPALRQEWREVLEAGIAVMRSHY